jgi:hypothetical protein
MTGSRLRYSLDAAIGRPQDWSFSWMLMDDVTFGSTCGFCGQSRQRISYEIMRDAERLWICQRCAGRYCLGGMLDGLALDQATIRGQLHGLTARLKQRTCQDIVHKVSAGAEDQALLEVALYFDRNLQLSPLHAARLFLAIAALEEPIDRRVFEVQTRSQAHQHEFGELDNAARSMVWPALTPQQKCRLTSLGFAPKGLSRSKDVSQRQVGRMAHPRHHSQIHAFG